MAQVENAVLQAPVDDDFIVAYHSQWSLVWRRFRRDRVALLGAVLVGLLIFIAIFAPLLAPHDPSQIFDSGLTLDGSPVGPSRQFPLGADALGHDQLSRILYGARVSLTIGIVANGLAMLIGRDRRLTGRLLLGMAQRGAHADHRRDDVVPHPAAGASPWSPCSSRASGSSSSSSPSSYWAPVARIIHGQVLGMKYSRLHRRGAGAGSERCPASSSATSCRISSR